MMDKEEYEARRIQLINAMTNTHVHSATHTSQAAHAPAAEAMLGEMVCMRVCVRFVCVCVCVCLCVLCVHECECE